GAARPGGPAGEDARQPAVCWWRRLLAARPSRPGRERNVARGRIPHSSKGCDAGDGRSRRGFSRAAGKERRGLGAHRPEDGPSLRPVEGPGAHRPGLRASRSRSEDDDLIAGPPLTDTELPLKLFARGKVRDTYELNDEHLLMVATDRISAFDHVLPNGIPDRGKVLTQLSIFWFSQTDTFQPNHLVSGMVPDLPAVLKNFRDELAGRFMIVRKAKRIDFECVVRGYLAGSAWKEYEESQTLA